MRKLSDPKTLHLRAFELWQKSRTEDENDDAFILADRNASIGGESMGMTTNKRATNWATTLFCYEQFWREDACTPRESTHDKTTLPPAERRLGEWGRYQRRTQKTLTGFQRIRLDVSPAFRWDPRQAAWLARLAECQSHLRASHQLPYLNSTNCAEFALARWLGRQLKLLQSGTLALDRVEELEALLAEAHRATREHRLSDKER